MFIEDHQFLVCTAISQHEALKKTHFTSIFIYKVEAKLNLIHQIQLSNIKFQGSKSDNLGNKCWSIWGSSFFYFQCESNKI